MCYLHVVVRQAVKAVGLRWVTRLGCARARTGKHHGCRWSAKSVPRGPTAYLLLRCAVLCLPGMTCSAVMLAAVAL